VITQ